MSPLDELAAILRPAGAGIFLFSTGRAEQLRLQQRLYDAGDEATVRRRFEARLEQVLTAKGVLLGIPSDVGAGFRRGANFGPQAIRLKLLDDGVALDELGVVDVGDVFCVPQLLHDEMLSEAQLGRARAALYPGVAEPLPVSPLSIAERAWQLIFSLNPDARPFSLGGDHSTALPAVRELHRVRPDFALVQSDAHTDLLPERLGITYCFATWSWHANQLLGGQGRLTQVGIRASGRDQAHWESTTGVRQFWAAAIRERPAEALDEVLAHVKGLGREGVFFSNDIDGTDSRWADATGTPEPDGLEPNWLIELIRRLGAEVGMVGSDVMEVAPILTATPESGPRTVGLAATYLREAIGAARLLQPLK